MNEPVSPVRLLMAEDDPEDQLLVQKAFAEYRLMNCIEFVSNGEDLLDFLNKRGAFTGVRRPDLILLDLNMPKKDGREALREIKNTPELRSIPVVVLTTSAADEDIMRSYDLGVSSYIQKPVTFQKLVEMIHVLGRYWFEIVKLPANRE